MTILSVSLDVISPNLTLRELDSIIGMSHAPSSHDLGTPSPLAKAPPRKETIWRLDSVAGELQSLYEHVLSLSMSCPFDVLFHKLANHSQCVRCILSIAICYSTYTCTITLSTDTLTLLKGFAIDVEISCYPGERNELGDHD